MELDVNAQAEIDSAEARKIRAGDRRHADAINGAVQGEAETRRRAYATVSGGVPLPPEPTARNELVAELQRRGQPQVVAEAMAAGMFAERCRTLDGGHVLYVKHLAEPDAPELPDAAGWDDERRYQLVASRPHPIAEGVALLLDPDGPEQLIERRARAYEQWQERQRALRAERTRLAEEQAREQAIVAQRRAAWQTHRVPRALFHLAAKLDAKSARLVIDLATAIAVEAERVDEDPPQAFIEALGL